MIRAFIAVELPASIKQALAQSQAEVRNRLLREQSPGMRIQWVRPDSIHLTMKFLGDIPEDHVGGLQSAVGDAIRPLTPFTVDVTGLGVFPDLRAPRVLWVGLSSRLSEGRSVTALAHLAEAIEQGVEGLGYPPESRPFNPHLTLARIKEGSTEVGRALTRLSLLNDARQIGQLEVRTVALMRSELKPSGSVYTRLWELPIGSAG
jgi:2'-5' RNA ligase